MGCVAPATVIELDEMVPAPFNVCFKSLNRDDDVPDTKSQVTLQWETPQYEYEFLAAYEGAHYEVRLTELHHGLPTANINASTKHTFTRLNDTTYFVQMIGIVVDYQGNLLATGTTPAQWKDENGKKVDTVIVPNIKTDARLKKWGLESYCRQFELRNLPYMYDWGKLSAQSLLCEMTMNETDAKTFLSNWDEFKQLYPIVVEDSADDTIPQPTDLRVSRLEYKSKKTLVASVAWSLPEEKAMDAVGHKKYSVWGEIVEAEQDDDGRVIESTVILEKRFSKTEHTFSVKPGFNYSIFLYGTLWDGQQKIASSKSAICEINGFEHLSIPVNAVSANDLLKKWGLEQYIDQWTSRGWDDISNWGTFSMKMLAPIWMNTEHATIFLESLEQWITEDKIVLNQPPGPPPPIGEVAGAPPPPPTSKATPKTTPKTTTSKTSTKKQLWHYIGLSGNSDAEAQPHMQEQRKMKIKLNDEIIRFSVADPYAMNNVEQYLSSSDDDDE